MKILCIQYVLCLVPLACSASTSTPRQTAVVTVPFVLATEPDEDVPERMSREWQIATETPTGDRTCRFTTIVLTNGQRKVTLLTDALQSGQAFGPVTFNCR